MPLVRAAISDADLTILGEGPLKPDLLAQRERLGLDEAVHLAGFQPNPYPYFKHADLFVLPSRFEGFASSRDRSLGCRDAGGGLRLPGGAAGDTWRLSYGPAGPAFRPEGSGRRNHLCRQICKQGIAIARRAGRFSQPVRSEDLWCEDYEEILEA